MLNKNANFILQCVKIIPEKAEVVYLNKKYLSNNTVAFVTHHGKNGPSYLNLVGANKQTWDNNVTMSLVVYEYIGKGYKRSFVEFRFKLCEMLHFDPTIGAMVARTGLVCPIPPALHRLVNMTIPGGEFKYVVFFKKCMVTLELTVTSTGESMGKANLYFSIIHK
ncbi:hypothetical protein ABMA28_008024 [Loxostege sticticalis]|uniref:Uncharacterized protein n=1 Tax=Loxostege sticticalis TaxID=481309 RepID=A0ABD0SGD9_LOXSC